MEAIVLGDDDLRRLETRFGPVVRQMGPWNSDGVFGYCSVPISAVEEAIESLEDHNLREALSHLKDAPEQTKTFVGVLDGFGPALIERIVAAYRNSWSYPS